MEPPEFKALRSPGERAGRERARARAISERAQLNQALAISALHEIAECLNGAPYVCGLNFGITRLGPSGERRVDILTRPPGPRQRARRIDLAIEALGDKQAWGLSWHDVGGLEQLREAFAYVGFERMLRLETVLARACEDLMDALPPREWGSGNGLDLSGAPVCAAALAREFGYPELAIQVEAELIASATGEQEGARKPALAL